jgi:hypothetical protein
MWHKVALYNRRYPARVAGYLSAVILYINKHFPNLPIDIIIPSVMIMIGLGEGAQRIEHKKSIKALYSTNDPNKPDEDILDKIVE